ncbi:uncharacterized protein [Oscarella lobularis]|uniref:uncharacterized protein n=1 Tax=Oscarella lobularis TaxID=121494 RepID=UPI0033144507
MSWVNFFPIILVLACARAGLLNFTAGAKVSLYTLKVGPSYDKSIGSHPYSLPTCIPDLDWEDGCPKPKNSEKFSILPYSAKEIMKMSRMSPSPSLYEVSYLENFERRNLCTRHWSEEEKLIMLDAVEKTYDYELYCDGLVRRASVGYKERLWSMGRRYAYTHLNFTFLYDGSKIVGFHVEEDGGYCLNCEGYGSPTFTYSVNWMEMKKNSTLIDSIFSIVERDHKLLSTSSQWFQATVMAVLLLSFWTVIRFLMRCMSQPCQMRKHVEDIDDVTDSYDLVVDINWFDRVIEQDSGVIGDGWEVTGASALQGNDANYPTTFISVLGMYNKGKTFVLNRIGGTNLPEGVNRHTIGISLKRAKESLKRFTLVDIAGFEAPVKVERHHDKQVLGHRKAIEQFVEDVVLQLGLVYIVIIGDMTVKDQEYLNRVSRKLHEIKAAFASHGFFGNVKASRFSDVIVIHNFAIERNLKKCATAFEKQITVNYDKGHWVDGEHGRYYITKEVVGEKAGMRHVFIGRSDSQKTEMDKHNETVFQLVRQWIVHGTAHDREVCCLEEVVRCCNSVLPNYTNKPPPLLQLMRNKKNEAFIGFPKSIKAKENNEKLAFLIDGTSGGLGARPREPPYDILYTNDAVFILLDSSATNVEASFDPHNRSCQVTGLIPTPIHYSSGRNRLLCQKRYFGSFDIRVDLSIVPGVPVLHKIEVIEEKQMKLTGSNQDADVGGTVIKLKANW